MATSWCQLFVCVCFSSKQSPLILIFSIKKLGFMNLLINIFIVNNKIINGLHLYNNNQIIHEMGVERTFVNLE